MKFNTLPILLAGTFLSTSAIAQTVPTIDADYLNSLTGDKVSWEDAFSQGDGVIKIGDKFYKYTYSQPSDYSYTSSRINGSFYATDVTNKVFRDITSSSAGGAIYNTENNSGTNIKSDFVDNGSFYYHGGGAIRNEGNATIGNITGDFIGNEVTYTNSCSYGGAISNGGTIGNIIGDFIGNYVSAATGSTAIGGAIYSFAGTIGDLTGDFIGNHAISTGSTATGGAIYNDGNFLTSGTIGNITGNFIGNYVSGYDSYAGAIFNKVGAISDITGDFIDNYTSATNNYAETKGGAIYNEAHIGNIKGDFSGNYASATGSYGTSKGGAVYNTYKIGNIEGNFTGNYAHGYYSFGGAIYNSGNAIIGDITGDFIGNYVSAATGSTAIGGAIYNDSGTIGDIAGNFIGNYASGYDSYAGAIFNKGGTIGDITGNFSNNYAYSSGVSDTMGGAIYNDGGTIGNIEGDFTGNYINGGAYAKGGAVYNTYKIGNITGDFTGNYASGSSSFGGAIYNSGAIIGDITGDFNNNYAYNGGAIHNINYAIIGDIAGNFVGNYTNGGPGSAIDNRGTIGNIVGNFIDNYSSSYYSYAGAIANIGGDIGNIEGDFTGNYVASSGRDDIIGGAIFNEKYATIGNIIGDFSYNYVSTTGSSSIAQGGAIYNDGTIGNISGSFLDNYATSTSSNAYGGAIYSSANITLLADNQTNTIKGNYVEDINGKRYEAIYMDNANATLTLKANNKGTIEVYDIIDGVSGYDVKLTGDGTGSVSLFNDVKNADIITENVEVNFSNGEVKDYSFKSLNVGNGTSWNLDVNLTNKTADRIISEGSGTINLGKINNIGSTDDVITVQVLKNSDNSDNLQLALGDNFKIFDGSSEIENTVNYSDNYIKVWGVTLATTDTTNDSIKIEEGALYDSFALLNDKETDAERSYIFDESGHLTLNEDLSASTAGTLNIVGFNNDAESSVIDANGNTLFDLSNATTLNVSGVTLSNASGDAITVSDQAELNLTNVLFENNGGNAITSSGNVNINVKDTDIDMSENIAMNNAVLSFNVENGALNLSNEVSGSDYNLHLKGGNVKVSGSVSGVNKIEMSQSAILGLGKSGRISVGNMMHAQDGSSLVSLQSNTSPTLQIDVDVANNRMTNGIIDVSGDVSGVYNVIVNALTTEYADGSSIFLTALQDDATTSSEFSVLRVEGSPYMWKTILNAEGETEGSTWYLAMEKQEDPDGPEDPNIPDNPSVNTVSAPEVIAGIGLHTAGIEQTRTVVRNVAGKVANARSYCPNCGIVSDAWDGKQLYNGWVLAQGEYSNIDKPVDMKAKIWGVEGGFDLQSDMNNTFGIFASYRNGEYDLSGKGARYRSNIGSEIEIDSYLAGLYYRYDKNMNWVFATVYGGTQDAEAKTDDGIASFETDGLEFGASVEVGHSFALNRNTTLSPSLGIFYTQINYDNANDNVGKEYKWDDIKHLEAELGLSLAKNFENGKAYVKPSVIQTLTDDDSVSITGLNKADTYHDQTLGRVEIGGNYGFNDNWSAYGWANYTFGSNYDATSLGVGANYSW